jgi:hypothetical protein
LLDLLVGSWCWSKDAVSLAVWVVGVVVQAGNDGTQRVAWGQVHVVAAVHHLVGNLQAQQPALKAAMQRWCGWYLQELLHAADV